MGDIVDAAEQEGLLDEHDKRPSALHSFLMQELGWHIEWHDLPNKNKGEWRYHKDGSEVTDDEIDEIFHEVISNYV